MSLETDEMKRKRQASSRQRPAILSRRKRVRLDSEEEFELHASDDTLSGSDSASSFSEYMPPNEVSQALWKQFRTLDSLYSKNEEKSGRLPIPLPQLSFAASEDVWDVMIKKEEAYKRNSDMLANHPSLQPRMRSILLDWLIEVCEVYKLHRETFYLAQDFIDRYIGQETNIPKQRLQLIGITALFIAAKIEEIYPPKLTEFVYVTDGACSDNDIFEMELIILKALEWNLNPITANGWLTVFFQLSNPKNFADETDRFLVPYFSPKVFFQVSRLLDLSILDIGCRKYSYSQLAAAAFYHFSTEEITTAVSGFQFHELNECVDWMAIFATSVRESDELSDQFLTGLNPDEQHNIQLHSVDLNLLDSAQTKKMASRCSPPLPEGLLTPPNSGAKDKNP